MEGLSGTLAGCRGGMRVGLSCWEKGREELTVEQDWGWGSALVSPKIYTTVEGETARR